jgi:hypothetical protein
VVRKKTQVFFPASTVKLKFMEYHGWDVHAWTSVIRTIIQKNYPTLGRDSMAAAAGFSQAVAQLPKEEIDGFPNAKIALDKIKGRVAVIDNDLGLSVQGMYVLTWILCQRAGLDGIRAFVATLDETAGTCVQGDTHRLFLLMNAMNKC